MPITMTCPNCGVAGERPGDLQVGEGIACPACGAVFAPHIPPPPPGPEWFHSPIPIEVVPFNPTAETPAWIRTEAERFEQYVARELGKLERSRHAVVEAESQAERRIVAMRIELNRLEAEFAQRSAEWKRQAEQREERARVLAAREADVERAATALEDREADLAAQETRRAELESEAAELGRLVAELSPAVDRLRMRKAEAETVRKDLAARQEALDRRAVEVGRMELALRQRRDELDELETTLREELERRERDLERQRLALEEEARGVRTRAALQSEFES